jgi:hypothetical protein
MVFFEGVTTSQFPITQWVAPYWCIFRQHYLELVSYYKQNRWCWRRCNEEKEWRKLLFPSSQKEKIGEDTAGLRLWKGTVLYVSLNVAMVFLKKKKSCNNLKDSCTLPWRWLSLLECLDVEQISNLKSFNAFYCLLEKAQSKCYVRGRRDEMKV